MSQVKDDWKERRGYCSMKRSSGRKKFAFLFEYWQKNNDGSCMRAQTPTKQYKGPFDKFRFEYARIG